MRFRMILIFVILQTTLLVGQQVELKPGVRTLFLIRHGDYDHDDDRHPDIGRGLIPLGIAQARLVGERLRSLPVKMNTIHASSMTRARETAYVIAESFPELKVQLTKLIRETVLPHYEDSTSFTPAAKKGQERLNRAFDEFFVPSQKGDRHDVLVCHGNVIRYLTVKALGVEPLAWRGMSIINCSITVIKVFPNGRMRLISFNDVGHLPVNLQTGVDGKSKQLIVPGIKN